MQRDKVNFVHFEVLWDLKRKVFIRYNVNQVLCMYLGTKIQTKETKGGAYTNEVVLRIYFLRV